MRLWSPAFSERRILEKGVDASDEGGNYCCRKRLMELVKHPIFHHEKLAGKKVAWCEDCLFRPGLFRVGRVRSDGFHELVIVWWESVSSPNSGNRPTFLPKEVPMNQDSVNKIVIPESDSQLGRMGFPFAVVQDKQSEILVKADRQRKPTGSQ